MRTMLGMSSWASTTPLARHARKAVLWPRWGLASSMPRPQVQSRKLRSRLYSVRFMCRFVARVIARIALMSPRSAATSSTEDAAGAPSSSSLRTCCLSPRAFAHCAFFAASAFCLRLLNEVLHAVASRAERAASALLARRRCPAAFSSLHSSTKRSAISQWLVLAWASACPGTVRSAAGSAGQALISASGCCGGGWQLLTGDA